MGFVSIVIGSALSNAGGIGGGGLFIPILILVLEFYTHEAIPISKLMIFVGAVTAFILNLKLKHPSRHSISIDFNIAILIVPMLLFGTVVGVTLNKITPSFIILILLTFVLLFNSFKTIKRAINIYRTENEENLLKGQPKSGKALSVGDNDRSVTELQIKGEEKKEKIPIQSHLVRIELERDRKLFRWDKFKFMILAYVTMIILTFLKGSDHFKSFIGVKMYLENNFRCSASYWSLYFLYLPIAVLITYYSAKQIQSETLYRIEIGFPYDNHDIMWNKGMLFKYPIYGFFAGLTAGLVGIGGGLIIGPLLIELGINPIISTSTSNFLVLFTSSSTSLQFTMMGMMNMSYGGICTLFSFLGSFIGTVTVHYILFVLKRESVLVFALALVLVLSTILLPVYSLIQSIGKPIDIFDFNSPC